MTGTPPTSPVNFTATDARSGLTPAEASKNVDQQRRG